MKNDVWMLLEVEHQPIVLGWLLYEMFAKRGDLRTADIYLRDARHRIDAMNAKRTKIP